MPKTVVSRSIDAPVAFVFKAISDIRHFSKAIPHIAKIEYLTEQQSGVGTRFRETRLMNGKVASTELEVTEFVENERIRLVADSDGTLWDSVFVVKAAGDQTDLTLTMDATPQTMMAKMMAPMTKHIIQKALEDDMDSMKTYCEKHYDK